MLSIVLVTGPFPSFMNPFIMNIILSHLAIKRQNHCIVVGFFLDKAHCSKILI